MPSSSAMRGWGHRTMNSLFADRRLVNNASNHDL
ncbi:Hypothetical protein, conserved [Brucella abortus str. 2308 A]|uniref:Uncharacterized protein n=1 Tax=Brucella melitensis biotype 2 (strain ATCC 23457) TaxID=546272 RepID=C0RII0_BRUMB|nr:Hypothetical protein, conserved [Brucella melitensis ATCC 23457]EEP64325.1 Hypothetical protein, conserved [Brucella abortus str. 2308 A]